MDIPKYESQIEEIATMMEKDNISPDEQDMQKLSKYSEFAMRKFGTNNKDSVGIIYEALLYMKLKSSESADPLQDGDKFGAGFS